MANLENLRTPTSEEAKEMQKKSVEARYENTIKRKLIEEAIRKELTDEDLHDIARGIIKRAKDCTSDLVALRDTLGEKPVEKVDMNANISYEEAIKEVADSSEY
jgi:3-methyladenine DNA glycosylase AlkD